MKSGCRLLSVMLAIIVVTCVASSAFAQGYPNKPIRWIVPFTPGGVYDVLARAMGQKLMETWGQQVVVDNRAGGNTVIGTEMAARAVPDGYTLLMGGVQNLAIIPCMYNKLSYDTTKDFAPVTFVGFSPLILVVNPGLPVKSVKELIELAKSKPGKLNFASAGSGGSNHLSMELFKMMTGVDMVHIAYKGSTPALIDLMGGQVELMFDSIVSALPHVKSGKLRPLAVSTTRRSPAAPDVPTVAEAGVPGFEVSPWFGVVAPAGTPKGIVAQLSTEINKFLQSPDGKERLSRLGVEAVGTSPEYLGQYIKDEIIKWAKVVKESGARID
jgi:tripartite-type tricarboxylate transporter receptor subunit TctC